jgi:predicted RNA methylase
VNLFDRHYTPERLADEVAELAAPKGSGLGSIFADPAAGDGALLDAVAKYWPDAQCLASDVDRLVVSRLRRNRPGWWISQCNLLSAASRARARFAKIDVDTVVLNPPFTSRGGARVEVDVFGESLRSSPAAAFALLSLERVKAGGRLVALLPASVLSSDKDEVAREVLFKEGGCVSVRDVGSRSFSGVVTRVLLVAIERGQSGGPASWVSAKPRGLRPISACLQRGRVPMHKPQAGGPLLPMVHTTDLSGDVVRPDRRATSSTTLPLSGPAVLLPRVGLPRPGKVVRYESKTAVALSDCVFAVKVANTVDAIEVQHRLRVRSEELCAQYRSSCAPYVTRTRLASFLRELSIRV